MRLFSVLLAAIAFATAVPALAQAPTPRPTGAMGVKTMHVSNLVNPGSTKNKPATMSGQGCTSARGANAAAQSINPITGQAQAAPLVSVPIGGGSSTVASATTHAQQMHACAHPTH